ncbi:hypothetical protein ARMSODRAFT_979646 [Armillaria solidipes]|uniref:Uncharacterized protein n=1 Tax=Armillaria solidipes TaxID=1076256 RepID=A0A2H3AYJ7_9AGAR|nr:hypothetical protein ARMSODRAFT_979646 [Armillaria solidipes]
MSFLEDGQTCDNEAAGTGYVDGQACLEVTTLTGSRWPDPVVSLWTSNPPSSEYAPSTHQDSDVPELEEQGPGETAGAEREGGNGDPNTLLQGVAAGGPALAGDFNLTAIFNGLRRFPGEEEHRATIEDEQPMTVEEEQPVTAEEEQPVTAEEASPELGGPDSLSGRTGPASSRELGTIEPPTLDLQSMFTQLRQTTSPAKPWYRDRMCHTPQPAIGSLPLFTESTSPPHSPLNNNSEDDIMLEDLPLPSSDDEDMDDQDMYGEFLPDPFPNASGRRTIFAEVTLFVGYESPDRRTGVYVERGLHVNVTEDHVNPTMSIRRLVDRLMREHPSYIVGTNNKPLSLASVQATVAGQMSYQEVGRLDRVLESRYLDNICVLPCLDCPEKQAVDMSAVMHCGVEELPCYVLYLTSPDWDSTANMDMETRSTAAPSIVASTSLASGSEGATVHRQARSREEEWPRWDTMFLTMIDVLVTLGNKDWNSTYKCFAVVQVVVAISEKLGLIVYGWGCNNSLVPVQTWLLDRLAERPAQYLHVEWRTFQNWVSALWNDLELVYRHLVRRVVENLPLTVDGRRVYDRLKVWYTLPLADAMTGVYTPTDQELLILKDTMPYEAWTALIAAQRVEARNVSSGSEVAP